MTTTSLVLALIAAIIIIIAGIVIFKLNPSISLVIATLFLGIVYGFSLLETVKITSEGFGNMMMSIGLPVGFGVILGELMSVTGCANAIADGMLKVFKDNKAPLGIALAGLIITIPVFFDIAVIIIMPVAIAVARQLNKPLPLVTAFLAMGSAVGQSLIPPTPNPLAAGEIFGFDLGIMLVVGSIIGLITVVLSTKIYGKLFESGKYWNDELDVNHEANIHTEISEVDADLVVAEEQPSFWISMLPIIVPVIFILMGTIGNVMYGENIPQWMLFMGDKIIAMLAGAVVAYLIAWRSIGRKEAEKAANIGLESAGMVLLITGAGGSFGRMIQETDIGNTLVQALGIQGGGAISILLFAYLVATVFRVAQGSGTVAGITAMQIMASMSHLFDIHPVWIAVACLAGGNSLGHVNDSGFWVVTNLSGLNVTGGIKTYTIGIFITSVIELILAIIGASLLPNLIF